MAVIMFLGVRESSEIKPPFALDAVHPLDNVEGNASSTVVIIEYSDFQCPACRTYYAVMKALVAEFGGEVAFVYRHFPLTGLHANAELAARAAEAAKEQGKFWEMHDLLFEKQNEWASASSNELETLLASYAKILNISVEKFKADWLAAKGRDFVRAQRNHAIKTGLQGTPSFFVNGKQIQNPSSIEAFRKVIRDAITAKKI